MITNNKYYPIYTVRAQVKEHATGCPKPGFDAGLLRLSLDSRREHGLPLHLRYCHRGEALPLARSIVAIGAIVTHPRYGTRLEIDDWQEVGQEEAWIYHSIAELPGVGKTTVERLRRKYGGGILDILNSSQAQHLLQQERVGPKQATAIVTWWASIGPWYRDLLRGLRCGVIPAPVRRRVEDYLREHTTWGRYKSILTDLSGNTMQVPANPYEWSALRIDRDQDRGDPLRVVDGFSLNMANAMADALEIPPTAPDRIIATLVGLLEDASHNGHTCQPWHDLHTTVCSRLGLPSGTELDAVLELARHRQLLTLDRDHLYLTPLLEGEMAIAAGIRSRLDLPSLPRPEPPPYLSPEQVAAFASAFAHGVSVLTAPPGRGKSETVIAIADAAQKRGIPILLVAPTGRAAVRLNDLAQQRGIVLSVRAGTIHRLLLGQRGIELAGTGPGLCVIEEASMVDVEIMGAALAALPHSWHVLIVGDIDQLPSVGPGTVLHDLVASEIVPVHRLERNWRSESEELAAAIDSIRLGKPPNRSGRGFNLRLVEPRIFASIDSTADLVLQVLDELSTTYGVDRSQILIVTPRNRIRGDPETTAFTTAAQALGPRLRRSLNPRAITVPEGSFAVGDRVLHRKNDYTLERFNGEQGIVRAIRKDGVLVEYPDGETFYSTDQAEKFLLLNFVGTVHRNQGGEADIVLLLLRASDGILLEKRLVYTGVSRARRACLVLAEPKALEIALANDRPNRRCGLLLPRLKESLVGVQGKEGRNG